MTKEKILPRHLFFCFAFLFILCNVTVTFGQTLPPAAQEAINKGIIAAKIPDYLLAINYFEEARKIAPQSPEVFFNLGLAESKIPGRELRAICWFGVYLTANPTASNIAAVKEQINQLDVKNKSNVSRFLITAQDAAVVYFQSSKREDKSSILFYVTQLWLDYGDIAMAQKACNLIYNKDDKYDLFYKSMAQLDICSAQVKAGDIDGAQKKMDKNMLAKQKTNLLVNIAYYQFNNGDKVSAKKTLADAVKTANKIDKDPEGLGIETNEGIKGRALVGIVEAQLECGDIEGAQKATGMITVSSYKDIAVAEIIEAQKKLAAAQDAPVVIKDTINKTITKTDTSNVQKKDEVNLINLAEWIKKLDDDVEKDDCPLKTEIFLDLDSYVKSLLRSDDSGEVYGRLKNSAEKIVKARNIIMQSLKAQIGN